MAFALSPCIYCGSTAPRVGREHVVPQAFGKFEQNLTLDCVCDECNTYFCRELDLPLARDGTEGFLRLQRGLKPATAARQLLNRRIATTIEEPGPYLGAHAVFDADLSGEDIQPTPVPQVGFSRTGSARMTWIREDELSADTVAPFRGPGVHVRVVAQREEDQQRLVERIRELGISFIPQGRFEEPVTNTENRVWVETAFKVDQTVLRGMAKIAFNYAAKMLGSELLRRAEFNEVRDYIRLGDLPGYPPVRVSRKPILGDDPELGERQTNGHLVCVGWGGQKTSIVGSVSLFNELTYDVLLCRNFTGVWREIAVGHLFDPFAHTITPLHRARLIRLN